MAVRISRSRFPILGSAGIFLVSYLNPSAAAGGRNRYHSFYLTILDAEGCLLDQSCNPVRIREIGLERRPTPKALSRKERKEKPQRSQRKHGCCLSSRSPRPFLCDLSG